MQRTFVRGYSEVTKVAISINIDARTMTASNELNYAMADMTAGMILMKTSAVMMNSVIFEADNLQNLII
ncbi:hypothetical protein NPIL_94401 [Nephila pilipes]|uniref:Uncharacterized protein n=1 Tax=Nephila pilipes TaxID=299642 RepID=A0A8X6NAS0_NEPPI|nr:hypothetical protein NPIL_94401 [Nephila pilipes]